MDAALQRRQVNEHSQERMKLARRLAQHWVAQPGCIAVMVMGSAAEGTSDAASDLDMGIYWAEAPRREVLEAARTAFGGGEHIFFFGDPADGGCAESYRIDGIKTDFAHSTLELWHAQTDEVLEKLNIDSLWQKGMSGTLGCLPLYGADTIAALQARLRPYPETLRLAMLERHCRFMPLYALTDQALGRGDLLWASQLISDYANRILFTLCALNGIYHAMEFKRLESFVSRELPLAPASLAARLDSSVAGGPQRGAETIAQLVRETLDLVAQYCPEYDIAPVRARFG